MRLNFNLIHFVNAKIDTRMLVLAQVIDYLILIKYVP
jgi:hypothetical protein